jgi:anti-sigma regulatory factor (Ser/Thr protein kinase)
MGRVPPEVSTSNVVLLPYMPASVATARWRLAADLREAGVSGPAIGDASLVLSELLSNAILHARPLDGSTVRVAWSITDGWLEVWVSDGGSSTRPRAQHPSPAATGGRGLTIVDHLARDWGVHSDGRQTTVWAVLPAPGHGRNGSGEENGSDPRHLVTHSATGQS